MNRAERRRRARGAGRGAGPVSVNDWRHAMMADADIPEDERLCLLAWSFHADPTTGELELPNDDRELADLTDRYLPRARLWLALNGYGDG